MTAQEGHNSQAVTGARIKAFVDRIERLEDEKALRGEDIKEVYQEAKSAGFEAKIIRKIISLRKQPTDKRREEEELLRLYDSAAQLGLFD
jgi:uncharacterized protein (UPF0335 family)